MQVQHIDIKKRSEKLIISFFGSLTLNEIAKDQKRLTSLKDGGIITLDLTNVEFIDTAYAIFIYKIVATFASKKYQVTIKSENEQINKTLSLVNKFPLKTSVADKPKQLNVIEKIGEITLKNLYGFFSFMDFLGHLFASKFHYLANIKNIRFKEIAFEINESAIKALWIVALTSFLIGVVVAYQSAFQLKIYGANIFVVDMLGISVLRELSPLITAIVIAGRSGSAFTSQIGAMKITQELDAMKTMGFDPYMFLVLPRIIALMLAMPILIFVSDVSAIIGGMIVANIDLDITTELFLNRFSEVVAAKHFFIGIAKGPFFAFLIATIGVYRGLIVKDDTQSIGFNTTKSVVESIFAVIVCDAIFSVAFTALGI